MTGDVQLAPVKSLLAEKGIRRVVVIDDCLDEAGNIVKPRDVEMFYARVAAADNAEELLKDLGEICEQAVYSGEDIPPEVITRLDKEPDVREPFRSAWESAIVPCLQTANSRQLDPFLKHLGEDLNLDVQSSGRLAGQAETGAQILFIDYILDPAVGPQDPLDADLESLGVAKAKARIKEVYNSYKGPKPVVVLMSNHPGLAEHDDSFCKDADLLPGVFFFAPKKELNDPFSLAFKMRTYAMANETGHRLQQFIRRFKTEAGKVVQGFAEDLKELSVNDYGYIQYLSLREDGQPLGEYLTWLFSCSLTHRLFADELRDERMDLDCVVYPEPPSLPSPADMSKSLVAELYNCAVFDTSARKLGPHPAPECGDGTDVYLKLGDIFRSLAKLLIVVNPACDLAYGGKAGRGKDRAFPSDLSVLLLPGELTPLSECHEKYEGTDLIRLRDGDFRITWKAKEIQTVRFERLSKWLEKRSYSLVAQMRLPHALRLQNVVARNITRVGTPVPAPFHRRVRVKILVSGEQKRKSDQALKVVLIRSQTELSLVIPEDVLLAARKALEEVRHKKAQQGKGIKRYQIALGNPGKWFEHTKPQKWAPTKQKPLGDLPVAVALEGKARPSVQHPIVIQLTESDVVSSETTE